MVVTSPDVSASLPELHNTIVVAGVRGLERTPVTPAQRTRWSTWDAIWEADSDRRESTTRATYDYQVNRPGDPPGRRRGTPGNWSGRSMRILALPGRRGADRDIVLMHGRRAKHAGGATFCAELLNSRRQASTWTPVGDPRRARAGTDTSATTRPVWPVFRGGLTPPESGAPRFSVCRKPATRARPASPGVFQERLRRRRGYRP